MRVALRAARRASGRTAPNPAVGAVVFRGERILAAGFTRPPGGPHAEVVALEAARRRAGAAAVRGASLAVTLEPCSHTGRTGPCTRAILEAGIRRVLVGIRDPHPNVAGRGIRRLRRAGVEVRVGVLEAMCREQHRGFLSVVERGRPFVHLKLAATLDGRIATASGESRFITGPAAREEVHRLRGRVDAVAVGAGTALADDPELTARRRGRVVHRPARVVFDTRLRVPPTARIYAGDAPALAVCGRRAPSDRRRALRAAGVRLVPVPARGGRVEPAAALQHLAREGVSELLVEGGGELGASLLRAGLVDLVHWFLAPRLLGGDGKSALGALACRRLAGAPRLEGLVVRRIGEDLYLRGAPASEDPPQ